MTGKVEVDLRYVLLDSGEDEEEEEEERGRGGGPQSVLKGIDWNALGKGVGGKGDGLGRFEMVGFLSNGETDTQAGVWRDKKAREVLVSFRGTQVSWKDFFTDILIVQEVFSPGKEEGAPQKLLVHAGFLRAFMSIKESVHRVIRIAAGGGVDGWKILVTGHSLGRSVGVNVCIKAYR